MKRFPLKRHPLIRKTFLIYCALSLVLLITPPAWTGPARHLVLLPLTLCQRGALWTVRATEQAAHRLTRGWRHAGERQRLRQRVSDLEADLRREQSRRETLQQQLRQFTSLPPDLRRRTVSAHLVGHSTSPLRRIPTFNKGASAGVVRNCPVFWNGVVVGRVLRTGPGSCEVALAGDRDCSIAVRCRRTRVAGILEGLGGRLCKVKYVGRNEDIRVGDEFVTSGLDGIFPPGRPVGTCIRTTSETGEIHRWVEVQTFHDIRRIETVTILLPAPGEKAEAN